MIPPREPHVHEFAEYTVCRRCGLTEAALEGCHHCSDQTSGICWWCLRDLDLAALRGELARLQQEIGAQFSHNTSLIQRINELEEDNDVYTRQMSSMQGIIDGTGSTGIIKGSLVDSVRDLVSARSAQQAQIRALDEYVGQLKMGYRGLPGWYRAVIDALDERISALLIPETPSDPGKP